jgi:hypothetical protein
MNARIDYRFTYRAQLDRVRRMRARFDDKHESLEAAQDIMWSFFQHCWHLKDWLKHDKVLVTDSQRDAVLAAAHFNSSPLVICRELCNATKHLQARPGEARHSHMNATLDTSGRQPRMECLVDDGSGRLIPGHELADNCIREWERILHGHGLSIASVPS